MSSIFHLIHRAAQSADALLVSNTNTKAHLTPRQYALLRALADGPENQTQTQLCAATGIDRSTLGTMLNNLNRHGLIRRQESKADRRVNHVTITPRGRKTVDRVTPAANRTTDEILMAIPASHRAAFVESLESIVKLTSPEVNEDKRVA